MVPGQARSCTGGLPRTEVFHRLSGCLSSPPTAAPLSDPICEVAKGGLSGRGPRGWVPQVLHSCQTQQGAGLMFLKLPFQPRRL